MAGIKIALANQHLNATLRAQPYPAPGPANIWIGLCTTLPDGTTDGVEVAANAGYVRQPITFGPAAGGIAASLLDAVFPIATVAYGTVKGWALWDAVSGGNQFSYFGALSSNTAVAVGNRLVLPAGTVTITET